MDKNNFRTLMKKAAGMISDIQDVVKEMELSDWLRLYDQTYHEVFPNKPYHEVSDPAFKMYVIKLMQWRHSIESLYPDTETDSMPPCNIVSIDDFKMKSLQKEIRERLIGQL